MVLGSDIPLSDEAKGNGMTVRNPSIPKPRTSEQNRAMHLFFGMLAGSLNSAGLDMRVVLKPSYSIPWTPESVKEHLWRPIQKAMTNKQSTTELNKLDEIDEIHETLMRELGQKFGVEYIPWPHFENGEVDRDGKIVIRP